MVSGAVYGDFHPSGRYGVFSSNIIIPAYHAQNNKRLEVYDTVSDLVIADFDNNKMLISPQTARKEVFETFLPSQPTVIDILLCLRLWNYRTAFINSTIPLPHRFRCRKEWGNHIDTLWNAAEHHASVCFPKASPDGRYLLYSVADYGFSHLARKQT